MRSDVERDPEKRCESTDVESENRTHYCRLTKHGAGAHICICQRTWGEKAAA